jgi:hypothetical protein
LFYARQHDLTKTFSATPRSTVASGAPLRNALGHEFGSAAERILHGNQQGPSWATKRFALTHVSICRAISQWPRRSDDDLVPCQRLAIEDSRRFDSEGLWFLTSGIHLCHEAQPFLIDWLSIVLISRTVFPPSQLIEKE